MNDGVVKLKKSKSLKEPILPLLVACPLVFNAKGLACARVLLGSTSAAWPEVRKLKTDRTEQIQKIGARCFTRDVRFSSVQKFSMFRKNHFFVLEKIDHKEFHNRLSAAYSGWNKRVVFRSRRTDEPSHSPHPLARHAQRRQPHRKAGERPDYAWTNEFLLKARRSSVSEQ
jgi:hypothetical protein